MIIITIEDKIITFTIWTFPWVAILYQVVTLYGKIVYDDDVGGLCKMTIL